MTPLNVVEDTRSDFGSPSVAMRPIREAAASVRRKMVLICLFTTSLLPELF